MIPKPAQIPTTDRRRRGLVGEIVASLMRRGSDRRYDRWSISGVFLAVAIPAGFVGVIWALVRLVWGA